MDNSVDTNLRSSIVKFVVAALLAVGCGFTCYTAVSYRRDAVGLGLSAFAAAFLAFAAAFFFIRALQERRRGE